MGKCEVDLKIVSNRSDEQSLELSKTVEIFKIGPEMRPGEKN